MNRERERERERERRNGKGKEERDNHHDIGLNGCFFFWIDGFINTLMLEGLRIDLKERGICDVCNVVLVVV